MNKIELHHQSDFHIMSLKIFFLEILESIKNNMSKRMDEIRNLELKLKYSFYCFSKVYI